MDIQAAQKAAYRQINTKRNRPWHNEEEVRLAWVPALEQALGIHFDAERSQNDGRYNNVIIEFKAPGLFLGSQTSAKFREATEERLLPYIMRASAAEGIPPEDFIGIAIDGNHICFTQVREGIIYPQCLIPFSEDAVGLVIRALRADTRRAVTADNLLKDFGHGAETAHTLLQALADALAAELSSPNNSKVKMLYEEWSTLYGQVADMSILQLEAVNQEIGFSWQGNAADAISGRLFVIHTYNSLIIKLLAAEIVAGHGLTSVKYPAQMMAAMLSDDQLLQALDREIEHSGIFSQALIDGFVEEAIFSWYLDVCRAEENRAAIVPALRGVLSALSLYRTDRLSNTRDVLRDLYQGLVPGRLRQSLGEYYTPDWLVDYTLDAANKGSWLEERVLDPCCGSGAFLLAVMRKKKIEAKNAGWGPEETLQTLCSSVWGFDLNPLAVQTSRVNFLMEIAEFLRAAPGVKTEIPILLADAIYSPAEDPATGEGFVNYKLGSSKAALDIELPSALALDRERLDRVFSLMGEAVEANQEYTTVEARLVAAGIIPSDDAHGWRHSLRYTYNQVLALHRQQWNGIWFRLVRNFFWSATAGAFDHIVGNPPWVRWSKLPDAYRERVKPTCEQYGIFSETKRHGGNELDISAIITYTTADKWLKQGGRLAFVITGTLFKNPSSAGFRKFVIQVPGSQPTYLSPRGVDDLKGLKPFQDAANHTSIVVLDKTDSPAVYPIPYRVWDTVAGQTRNIPATLSLDDVLARTVSVPREAMPVDADGSPWAVLAPGRHQVLRFLASECDWVEGRKGVTTDLNGVYFVPILEYGAELVKIRSRPEAGRRNIGPSKEAWVEPDLLFPLVKGAADFEACYLRLTGPDVTPLYTFVPNRGIRARDAAAAEAMMDSPGLQRTKSWFTQFSSLLVSRSTYRRQMQGTPFYSIYNVGEYTFKPWKVIWPEMTSSFYAAVAGSAEVPLIGQRPYIPDHKIYFAAFDEPEPAYFLCGLLNAPVVREWIESHTISIQIADVFKHTRLPQFDSTSPQHLNLAALVEAAHSEHDATTRATIVAAIESLADAMLEAWAVEIAHT